MKRLARTDSQHACPRCCNPLRTQSSTALYEDVFHCTCGVTVVALDSLKPFRHAVLDKLLALLPPRASHALRSVRSGNS